MSTEAPAPAKVSRFAIPADLGTRVIRVIDTPQPEVTYWLDRKPVSPGCIFCELGLPKKPARRG